MRFVVVLAILAALTACSAVADTTTTGAPSTLTSLPGVTTSTQPTTTTTVPVTTTEPQTTTTVSPYARPDWLGTRVLPERPDGYGVVEPTPPELQDRRFETLDLLPPPVGDDFESSIGPVPEDVLARSTWVEACPVSRDELAYVTVTHHGFDHRLHTGEIIVNASVADDVVDVFHALFDAGYPIEQMRVSTQEELDAPPTGDGNLTGSFECRPSTGGTSWSQHAYGLAIDVNPFQNPYVKGDLVLPELASAYLERDDVRPGMIERRDDVVKAFKAIGWGWGGDWNSLKDWMHFSQSGT
jgi:D-alanyl-D-alanine carboxypeptidase